MIREDHEMREDFEALFSSVTTFPPIHGIIPRSLSPFRWLAYLKNVKRLSNAIVDAAKQTRADVIWTFNDAYLAGPMAARKAKLKSVTHFLGMTSYQPKLVGLILMAFHKRYSDQIVTCQDITANDLARLGFPEEKITVVYHGIDIQRFSSKGPSEHKKGSSSISIGMVANLDRRKGHSLFIKAASIVLQSYPDAQFFIVGDLNGDETYLQELHTAMDEYKLHSNLKLVGTVKDMPAWFESMDICCVPSVIEALSVACLEAMASSLPMVATDVGGNSITVHDEVNGLLSKPNDAQDLADKISSLVASDHLREKYGKASRQLAESTFSVPRAVKILNGVFNGHVTQ